MRFLKIFVMVAVVVLVVQDAMPQNNADLSENPFFQINKDLKRIGLSELRNLSKVKVRAENYRLDPDFQLGHGDELSINFWGKLENKYELSISDDGAVVIPSIGKIDVIGMTLEEARAAIKREVDKKYANVQIDLNLVNVRDIRIFVLGYVKQPGPYLVSPFSRLLDALSIAGGPSDDGSLLDIRVIRKGQKIAAFKVYDFLFKGEQANNIALKQNDVVYVGPLKNLVAVRGDIRYPGIYELADNANLANVIELAGGMLPTRFKRKVRIFRINPNTKMTEELKKYELEPAASIGAGDNIAIENEDTVVVSSALDYTPYTKDLFSVIHVSGEVMIPGKFVITEGEKLSSVIKRAGGLRPTAFVKGAVLTRAAVGQKQKSLLERFIRGQERLMLEEETAFGQELLTREEKNLRQKAIANRRKILELMSAQTPDSRIIINLEDIMAGRADIILEDGDRLYIPTTPDWVLISGAVYNPGSVIFIEGQPLEYYINTVGGPTTFADRNDIYVIKADGRAESKSTGYGKIMRGDVIIVPEKADVLIKEIPGKQ